MALNVMTKLNSDELAQFDRTGLYSRELHERQNALRSQADKKARTGCTNSLNHMYSLVRCGELSREEYAVIRKEYDNANA